MNSLKVISKQKTCNYFTVKLMIMKNTLSRKVNLNIVIILGLLRFITIIAPLIVALEKSSLNAKFNKNQTIMNNQGIVNNFQTQA